MKQERFNEKKYQNYYNTILTALSLVNQDCFEYAKTILYQGGFKQDELSTLQQSIQKMRFPKIGDNITKWINQTLNQVIEKIINSKDELSIKLISPLQPIEGIINKLNKYIICQNSRLNLLQKCQNLIRQILQRIFKTLDINFLDYLNTIQLLKKIQKEIISKQKYNNKQCIVLQNSHSLKEVHKLFLSEFDNIRLKNKQIIIRSFNGFSTIADNISTIMSILVSYDSQQHSLKQHISQGCEVEIDQLNQIFKDICCLTQKERINLPRIPSVSKCIDKMKMEVNKLYQYFYQSLNMQEDHHQIVLGEQYQQEKADNINDHKQKYTQLEVKINQLQERLTQQINLKQQVITTNTNLLKKIQNIQNELKASHIFQVHEDNQFSRDVNDLKTKLKLLQIDKYNYSKKLEEKEKEMIIVQKRSQEALKQLKQSKNQQIQNWRVKYLKSREEIDVLIESVKSLTVKLQQKQSLEQSRQSANQHKLYEITRSRQSQEIGIGTSILQRNQGRSFIQRSKSIDLGNQARGNQSKLELEKRLKDIQDLKETIKFIESENKQLKKVNLQLQVKFSNINPEMASNSHLFPLGCIFQDENYRQRIYLLQKLTSYIGPIKKTKQLYRLDPYNKVNFHRYVDKTRHIVLIMKTIYGKMIAGYSTEPFSPSGIKGGLGLLLSLWGQMTFEVKQKQRAISYDDYYLIFGNSELRLKSLEQKLFSNFGIANSYYDPKGEKVISILGQGKDREVQLSHYEIYGLEQEND